MGRSRKPLIVHAIRGFESHPLRHRCWARRAVSRAPWTVQAVRGFESHPLRHRCWARRAVSRVPWTVQAVRGFESHPLRHMLHGRKEREEDIPAEQSSSQEEARFPSADEDQARPRDPVAAAPQGPQAADGLTLKRSGKPAGACSFEPGAERIRLSSDYRRVYRRGRRLHGEFAVFHVRRNEAGHARLGLTAARRVGGAVTRNRLRRRVHEHYRQVVRRERLPPVDVVVHLKPTAAAAGRRPFYRELDRLFAAVAKPGGRSRDRGRPRR